MNYLNKILFQALVSTSVSLFGVFSSANATTVSAYGYSLDTEKNIVSGQNLEWLQWDETNGMTIVDALAAYGGEGWRLATDREMAALFNAFPFGIVFDEDEYTSQSVVGSFAEGLANTAGYDVFIDLFGQTYVPRSTSSNTDLDPYRYSIAYFGEDSDGDGFYSRADVSGDYQQNNGVNRDPFAAIYGDIRTYDGSEGYGVSLVRPVPNPPTALLFLSGIFFVGAIRKLRKFQFGDRGH